MLKFLKRPFYLGLLRNAINAKLMLQNCTKDTKIEVYVYANALYVSNGMITNLESAVSKVQQNIQQIDSAFSRMNEFERNTLYSLALMELGVEPTLIGEDWNIPPSNPFAAASELDQTDIQTAVSYFWDKHRIEVSMDLRAGS